MVEARVRVEKMEILPSSHRAVAWALLFPFAKQGKFTLTVRKHQAIPESGYLDGHAAFSGNSACPSPEDLGTLKEVQSLLPGEIASGHRGH